MVRFEIKIKPDDSLAIKLLIMKNYMNKHAIKQKLYLIGAASIISSFVCAFTLYLMSGYLAFFAVFTIVSVFIMFAVFEGAFIVDIEAELIKEKKAMEDELEKMAGIAASSSTAKNEFLTNMGHEIRTPMNSIVGMVSMLSATKLDSKQKEYAESIKVNTESLLSIINDILDFAEIDNNDLSLENVVFNLREIVETLNDRLALRAQEKGIDFAYLIKDNVPTLFKGDPRRLKQIIWNLTENAIKFANKGIVSFKISLKSETEESARLYFEVTDTGIGIPIEEIDRLFESFSQLDASITRKFQGTGLGLVISKRLVELMGGRIGVESDEGKGAMFWFTIELSKHLDSDNYDLMIQNELGETDILVIDPNEVHRQMVGVYLSQWGCYFEEAKDRRDAIWKLEKKTEKNNDYDAIFIDNSLIGEDGEKQVKKILAIHSKEKPVFVLMGPSGVRGRALMHKEIKFDVFLEKPVKQTNLYECTRKVIELRSGLKSSEKYLKGN